MLKLGFVSKKTNQEIKKMVKKVKVEIKELHKEEIEVSINGITPLLMEKMDMCVVEFYDGKKGKKGVQKDNRTEQEKVEKKIHCDREGNPIIPSNMFMRCLEEVAPYIEGLDKKRIKGSVRFVTTEIPLRYTDQTINKTYGKTSGITKSPRLILRPQFNEWSCKFKIIYNAGLVSVEQIFNAFNIAGFNIGIGGWRPISGGDYGQFEVSK